MFPCTTFPWEFDGEGVSCHSDGGGFRYWGGVDVVGDDVVVNSRLETRGGGLRSLRMKRALVTGGGGGGSSLVGLGDREERLVRSLVGGEDDVEEGLERKRRTPFMLMGTCKYDALAQPTAGHETVLKWTINEAEAASKRMMSKGIYTIFGSLSGQRPACLRQNTTASTLLPLVSRPHKPSSTARQMP